MFLWGFCGLGWGGCFWFACSEIHRRAAVLPDEAKEVKSASIGVV